MVIEPILHRTEALVRTVVRNGLGTLGTAITYEIPAILHIHSPRHEMDFANTQEQPPSRSIKHVNLCMKKDSSLFLGMDVMKYEA